jgi:Fe2+ or Zn2+ uptake regulation protein
MQVVRQELKSVAAVSQQAGRIVTDPKIVGAILDAMSDELSRKILSTTILKGKLVEEISSDNNISLATAYRRVHDLAEKGLMFAERIIVTKTGRRSVIYRSAFRGVKIKLLSGEIQVQMTLNEDVAD